MTMTITTPRLGFLGVGWIGANRMDSLAQSGLGVVAAVADADADRARAVAQQHDRARIGTGIEELLETDLDGIVIATPSALHAKQTLMALRADVPVFCQKPLARSFREAQAVIARARERDLLLGVDMSYRHVEAFRVAKRALADSAEVYALDLRFHNAYGPDKPWFTDPQLSGGGCVIDLGTHLIDLALWWLGSADALEVVDARLYRRGRLLTQPVSEAEDYADVTLAAGETLIRLACSWFLPLGVDASIAAGAFTPSMSVEVTNVGGSFYDFTAKLNEDRLTKVLAAPPDDWGGRALCSWAKSLAEGRGFDASVEDQLTVASTIDAIYGRTA